MENEYTETGYFSKKEPKKWKNSLMLTAVSMFLFCFSIGHFSYAQKAVKKKAEPVICPAKNEDMFTRVNIPEVSSGDFQRVAQDAATAEFDITFGPGAQANPDARAAFQYALDIWATQIVSSVPIKVYADFADLGAGVLASAGPAYNVINFPGAPEEDVLYPAALANALAGEALFPDEDYDLIVNLGNGIPWYFGLDGNTPAGLYDFVTVALHEAGHGLGFTTVRGYSGGTGTIRSNGNPSVYGLFMVNGDGEYLIDFPDPSTDLGDAFTGGDLFMDGTFAKAALGGERPELYAPSSFAGGSSLAHWDEAAFPAGDPNSLMSPQVGSAESNFDIGDITRGLFKDMGWVINDAEAPPFVTTPASINVELTVGDTLLNTIEVSNISDTVLTALVSTTSGASTIIESLDPDEITIASGATDSFTVKINTAGLAKGIYQDTIVIASADVEAVTEIPVSVQVLDGTEAPSIEVSPGSFSAEIEQLQVATEPLTISNTGDADLTYSIVVNEDSLDNFTNNVAESDAAIAASGFQQVAYGPAGEASSKTALIRGKGDTYTKVVTSVYATGFENFSLGDINSQLGWASQYPGNWDIADDDPAEGAQYLKSVSDGLGGSRGGSVLALSPAITPGDEPFMVMTATVKIEGSGVSWEIIPQSPSAESVNTRLRFNGDGTIDALSGSDFMPVDATIPEGYFEVKIIVDKDDNSFSIYFDDEFVYSGIGFAPEIEQVVFLSGMEEEGSTFYIDEVEVTDGDPDAFFLSVSPSSGTVPFGASTTVDVKFDARALDSGEYTGYIVISSNDSLNSPLEVPVSLTVLAPPTIGVSPDSLAASVDVTVDDPAIETRTFTVTNSGESSLEFDASLGAVDFTPSNIMSSVTVESLNMALYGVGNTEQLEEKNADAPVRLEGGASATQFEHAEGYTDSIYYDSGLDFPSDFSGVETAAYTSAINFDVESDFTLTAVRNAFRTEAVSDPVTIVEIYRGGSTPNDGELLLSETVETASEEGIFAIEELSQALSFSAGESFWVVHKYPDGIAFPQGVDIDATQRPDTYFFSSDGGATYSGSGFVFLVRALSGGGGSSYVTLEPSSGTVAPGESMDVTVTFDGSTLANGTYEADIVVSSNDPVTPSTSVFTSFDVSGQVSEVELSDEYLLFNDVFLGAERARKFTIYNEGLALLNVTDISSDNADFTVSASSASIEANDSLEVTVNFAPTALGSINGIISISTDASNAEELEVVVNGIGVDPPIAVLSPDEVSETTDAGTTVESAITLENPGNSPLIFSFPDLAAASILADPNVQLNNTEKLSFEGFSAIQEKGYTDTRVGSPVLYSVGTDNGFGYTWIDSDEADGPVYNFTDITATGTEITTTLSGDGTTEIALSFPFEFYGETNSSVFINANGFVSFDAPSGLTYVNTQIPTEDGINNMIAGLWEDLEPQNFNGSVHYEDMGDKFIIQWTEASLYFGSADEAVTFQIVLHANGNVDVFYEDVSSAPFIETAAVGIENVDGTDGAQVAFNTDYIKDGLAVRFIKPAVSLTPFISATTPLSGVVPAGGSKSIGVTLDATELNDGIYYDELSVSSNAPMDTASTALFELTVIGYPEIQLTPDSLTFDSLFIGLSSEATFEIRNTGTKVLDISELSNSIGDFVLDTVAPISLEPDASLLVGVEFAPSSVGEITDEITIASTDAFGNEMTSVFLKGIGVDPPVIELSPDSLSVVVYEGDSASETVTIANTGATELNYSLTPPYFAKAGAANQEVQQYERLEFEKIRSKEQADTRVGPTFLNASGGPGTFGYSWVDNNSGGPAYDYIDISETGELASVGADGDVTVPLPFTFKFFGEDQNSVTIGANGFLTFGPLSGSNFSNDQIPNVDNPNFLIAGMWDDLEPQNGGGVFFDGNSERFIVQYDSVPGFGFPPFIPIPDPVSFQIIIYPNGQIKMQYEDVNSTIRTSSTVGLEGPEGLTGLQVIFNTEYLTDELAITFTPPISGTVAPGASVDVPITFYSENLEAGDTYYGDIKVGSNDPINPDTTIPVDMTVLSLPEVTSLTLINAELGEEVGELAEGDIINVDNYANNSFSIVAVTDTSAEVGSVVFDFNEVEGYQTENKAPYAIAGDYNGGLSYYSIELPKGINTVTATPYTGPNGTGMAGKEITVNFEVIDNTPDLCYGQSIMSYMPGDRKNGNALPASRSNPERALGAPQENDSYNFVALGFGGYIEIALGCEVMDHEGDDILIVETSFRDANQSCATYPETAMVEASADGENWVVVATEICRDGAIDLADGGLTTASYIRITDTSNPDDFQGGNADGYDVDGIVVISNVASDDQMQIVSEYTDDLNNVANEEMVEVRAYPNPVADYAQFSLNGHGDKFNVMLYNLRGNAVYKANITLEDGADTGMIDMRDYPQGLYNLRITTQDGAIVSQMKLLKN